METVHQRFNIIKNGHPCEELHLFFIFSLLGFNEYEELKRQYNQSKSTLSMVLKKRV